MKQGDVAGLVLDWFVRQDTTLQAIILRQIHQDDNLAAIKLVLARLIVEAGLPVDPTVSEARKRGGKSH